MYMSIHHDAGAYGSSAGGTTVYYYSSNTKRKDEAQAMYNAVVGSTGLKGNRAQKVIKKGYDVLKYTKAAAFLLENGFMDSTSDTPIILTEAHAEKTAQGLLKFIVNYFKLEKKDGQTENAANTLYKVQCGAFKNKDNAEALKNKLKAAGFEAVVVNG
jgi:N-acetylmuramoyl-L-alanine amidase